MKNSVSTGIIMSFAAVAVVLSLQWAYRDDAAPDVVTVGIAETCRGVTNDTITADAVVAARFSEAGAVAFVIPRTMDTNALSRIVSRIDALVLSGGEDVAPARYREAPDPKLEDVNEHRDAFEVALLDAASRRGIPVIGICRGCQLINVYFGGSLHQDIGCVVSDTSVHRSPKKPRDYVRHPVDVAGGSLLEKLAGRRAVVHSWHHQAAKKVAPGFRVTAVSADGITEAIESDKAFGVQFHPEKIAAPPDGEFSRRFFTGLIEWIASSETRPEFSR